MSIKIDKTREEVNLLNKQYHARHLASTEFYSQLESHGVLINASVLVSLVPDGSNTYFGMIITQDQTIFSFDIDLDNSKYSTWEDVTDQFHIELRNKTRNKPWAVEVVAYKIFNENSKKK